MSDVEHTNVPKNWVNLVGPIITAITQGKIKVVEVGGNITQATVSKLGSSVLASVYATKIIIFLCDGLNACLRR